MHVGVLGGGLQGCCTALALAERGVSVTLFDRNHVLLSRTAVANEGKVHLGYMYVGDPSLATARTMMQGALAFAPFIARHLGSSTPALMTSLPTAYAVHRDSQHSAEEVSAYLANVHRLIGEAVKGREFHYFGNELSTAPRNWSRTERNAAFDPGVVTAVFDTPEVAINPVALARDIEVRIPSHPLIETRQVRPRRQRGAGRPFGRTFRSRGQRAMGGSSRH
jgi:glycine/D-amino acid oxidase-like deaminating enzyme